MPTIEEQPTYNLGVVVQETGINPDTLRAWERRYGLPAPDRSEGGHRLYSHKDIQTVKWLIERQEEGIRIGQAVQLWKELKAAGRDPLREHPLQDQAPGVYPFQQERDPEEESEARLDVFRERWLQAALGFQEQRAEHILTEAFSRFSLEDVWERIISPGLAAVGQGWADNQLSVQQEHFTSSLVIRRLNAMIEAVPPPIREEKILISCPPREEHTFSALLLTLYLRRRGYPVIYLGANVPDQDLDNAVDRAEPDLAVMIAQTLDTASTLYQSALLLRSEDILLAFAGRIFERIPELTQKIPGYYLGDNFSAAADQVETILAENPADQPPGIEQPETYAEELKAFRGMELLIIDTVIKRGMQEGFRVDELGPANHHLRQTLEASLVLGDLEYLNQEIAWLAALLSSREFPLENISQYLQLFADAVQLHLPDSGDQIAEQLRGAAREWA
jgi:DNA-binding transcriptional MerR regulator